MARRKDIVKYSPLEGVFDLRKGFDNIVRDFFTGFSNLSVNRGVYPPLDIKEDNGKYIIEMEVPGIEKKDIKISVKKNNLIIQGQKREEKKKKEESYLCVERSYGKFRRSLSLSMEVDESKIKAKYDNGVLRVALPKTKKEKAKEVEIKIK